MKEFDQDLFGGGEVRIINDDFEEETKTPTALDMQIEKNSKNRAVEGQENSLAPLI